MATKTLAFEIGTEELPAFDLHAATERLAGIMGGALDAAGVPHGDVETYSTPRRLIMVVRDVPEQTEATEESFRGPSAKIAFDADGNPTKAAAGFARGKGVDVDALERRDEGGTEYVYAVVRTASRDVAGLLPGLLADVVRAVPWPKTQRWGSRSEQFSRPVRWLLALFGDQVVPWSSQGSSRATSRGGTASWRPARTRWPTPTRWWTCCAGRSWCRARPSARRPSASRRRAPRRPRGSWPSCMRRPCRKW